MSEYSRIRKLEELEIIGTRGAGSFFNIVELAATLCHAPVAALTFVDRTTRWFYAGLGVERVATPRDKTCCNLVLDMLDPLVIEDLDAARAEGRVEESEFPEWRSYAGAPVTLGDGTTLGALFVADFKPRSFTPRELNALMSIAALAVDNVRLHESLMRQQSSMMETHAQAELLERSNLELEKSRQDVELASKVAKIGFWSKKCCESRFEVTESLQKVLPIDAVGACSADEFYGCFPPEAAAQLRAKLEEAEESHTLLDMRAPVETPGGGVRWVQVTGRSVGYGQCLNGCVQDVTELLESRNKAARIAMLDTLTGVYNRRFLPVAFMRKKRKLDRENERLLVVTIDLDNFKQVNDLHGHDVGDQVLVDVTKLLHAELRDTDVVARLGGDEFLAIATIAADGDGGVALAERLRAAAVESPNLNSFTSPVTFSIGYCDATAADVDYATALKRSDLAVYQAKSGGRNRCVRYDDGMGVESTERRATLQGVDRALEQDAFTPYYQPKITLHGGAIVGAEVTPRWRSADGEIVGPDAFRSALDDARYAARIAERMLERALDDAARLVESAVDFGRLAINVASLQMSDPSFPDRLGAQCQAYGVPMARLELEITEQSFLSRGSDNVRVNLAALRGAGVRIAFDDFGAGVASMTHLLEFETDVIKINASLIERLCEDETARGITRSIIHLARSLGLEVAAENVSRPEESVILADMGCDVVQGAFYGAAMAIEPFAAFLEARAAEIDAA